MNTDLISGILPPDFFEAVECVEGKAILKVDLEKGVKIAVCDFNDMNLPEEWKILDILKETENVYTCLLKTHYASPGLKAKQLLDEKDYASFRALFESDVILDLPFILSKEKTVVTFSADYKYMRKLLENINLMGDMKSISIQPAAFAEHSVLSCLTERQKEVITAAEKSGYYDVPRKTSTKELSKKLGISRATTIEHLRKAEQRIISSILEGY